jgi:hypothetical protein
VTDRRPIEPDDARTQPSVAEMATRDAVRGLPTPRAEPAFRARLRHEFTTGRFGPRTGFAPQRPWWVRAQVLVPVAAGLLIVAGMTMNRGPDWRLLPVNGDGRVTVDGTTFSAGDAALAVRLKRGGHVRVEGAVTLDLVALGVAAVALAPGAEVRLSGTPGRWWARGMRAHVESGDAYFTTGSGFHGARLDVSTPEVSVSAVGTAFAVLREGGGTCVCVLEGHVHVGEAGAPGTMVDVPEGMRRVVHPGQASETHAILDDSVHRLHRQRDVAGEMLRR